MSNKFVMGIIPEKINYVSSATIEVNVGCEWDVDYGIFAKNKKEKVVPAFPTDNNDVKMLNKANSWAKSCLAYNAETKDDILEPKQDIVDNVPISKIKVLSLEYRNNGGRAYKALVNNYYVDMREDVVLDTMLNLGVSKGGVLKGEFVWAKIASHMKLVRVGSELHKLILEYMSKKDLKIIDKNDLEVGGIYQDKKKNRAVFLGFVDTVQYINKYKPVQKNYSFSPDFNDKNFLEFDKKKHKKQMLFLKLYYHEPLEKEIRVLKNNNLTKELYRVSIEKSHNFIEKIDSISISSDVVSILRHKSFLTIKESILKYIKKDLLANSLSYMIQSDSMNLNMVPSGETNKELFDLNKYLIFS